MVARRDDEKPRRGSVFHGQHESWRGDLHQQNEIPGLREREPLKRVLSFAAVLRENARVEYCREKISKILLGVVL